MFVKILVNWAKFQQKYLNDLNFNIHIKKARLDTDGLFIIHSKATSLASFSCPRFAWARFFGRFASLGAGKRNKKKFLGGSDTACRSTATQSVKEDVTTQSVVTRILKRKQ